jgi:hypothetical protein
MFLDLSHADARTDRQDDANRCIFCNILNDAEYTRKVWLPLYLINQSLRHEDVYGGEWSASRLRRFIPEETAPCTNWQEAEWAWIIWGRAISLVPTGNRTPDSQLAISLYRPRYRRFQKIKVDLKNNRIVNSETRKYRNNRHSRPDVSIQQHK